MIEVEATSKQFLGMPAARFLRDYWQQQPLLIRNAFADFSSPLSPDDLAGLACEDHALSRLVLHDPTDDSWTLRSGPFTEAVFAELPASHWTLLVQDVDKWDADVAALLPRFGFLPSWRLDDVMVSYAEDGGSVGAHVDNYDVFLLQGRGRRRWQISIDPQTPKAFRDDVELKLLREFTPTHEWLLEPGDMLYLPPGIAHHGVAEGACLTLSIGMRAPSVAEMLTDFAGHVAEQLPEELRYSDAGMGVARSVGEIDDFAMEKISQALRDSLSANALPLRGWFGPFITRYRAAHEAVPRGKPITADELKRRLEAGALLEFNPWSRFAWSRDGRNAILFVSGESHRCPQTLAEKLCRREPFGANEPAASDPKAIGLLVELVNRGHLAPGRARRKS
ncbi:JmjC domain-containing protein [Dokdonella sp.]|uniref:JmjC domain-containing protein n=1 Tax=Dokdonella sp. TaxID=2291710 RepID=UPI0035295493